MALFPKDRRTAINCADLISGRHRASSDWVWLRDLETMDRALQRDSLVRDIKATVATEMRGRGKWPRNVLPGDIPVNFRAYSLSACRVSFFEVNNEIINNF